MITKLMQDTKKWFEANYLDGDEIQGGQMLSSEECLDAVHSAQTRLLEEVVGEIEELIEKHQVAGNEFPLEELLAKLKQNGK